MKKSALLPLLQDFELMKGVPEDQLKWLITHAEIKQLAEGELVFEPGDPIDYTIIILDGQFVLFVVIDKKEQEIAYKSKGEVTGFLPFLRAKNATATGRVIEAATLLCLHRSLEREMLKNHYELSQVLVHEMTSRVQEYTNFQKQTEKMAALGKLSAGLAHELNNPAAAIVRSSQELKKNLGLQSEKLNNILKIQMTDELIDRINDLIFKKINLAISRKSLLEIKELEDNMCLLLEDFGIADPFELSEDLIEFGFEEKELLELAQHTRREDLEPILHWIGDNLMIEKLVNDIQESSERIYNLVNSVKVYTHMDQAQEKSSTNLHDGIENTLNILNHKIKNANVSVELDFDSELPPLPIFVSEMNQVWTNLLDNAIDAVAEVALPKITIKTWRSGEEAKISIIDNGNGISEETAKKIWEPFFTTKTMGKGTGLGLELVKNIIEKHQGNIEMKSQPGNTTFEITLPI